MFHNLRYLIQFINKIKHNRLASTTKVNNRRTTVVTTTAKDTIHTCIYIYIYYL